MGGDLGVRQEFGFADLEMDAKLRDVLAENERLRARLGAVRHSLGNHLALLSAILSRQVRVCQSSDAQSVLGAAQSRVSAVAEALRAVMIDPGADDIDLREPIARILEEYRAHASGLEVEFVSEVTEAAIGADEAVSLMLALNELAANALQHAFPDGLRGTLRVLLRREGDSLVLEVQDDGVGRDPDAEARLGEKIIMGAVRSLRARITLTALRADPTRPGLRAVLTAPLA